MEGLYYVYQAEFRTLSVSDSMHMDSHRIVAVHLILLGLLSLAHSIRYAVESRSTRKSWKEGPTSASHDREGGSKLSLTNTPYSEGFES